MKYFITLLFFSLPLFAQDFIPFYEKIAPEWQTKIKTAGVIEEREYIPELSTSVTPENDYYVASVYDKNGKLKSVSQKLMIDDSPSDYSYVWNSEGNLAEILYTWKDNEGKTSNQKYEFSYEGGKLNYVALYDMGSEGSGAMKQWLYVYAPSGNLERIEVKVFHHSESGAFSMLGYYNYDEKGRLSDYTTDFSKTTFVYNSSGKLDKKVTEASDIKITEKYEYDKAGNLIKVSNTGDAASIFDEIKYNASGLPILKKSLIKVSELDDETVKYHYSYVY